MAMTPAERQRKYRERLKKKALEGDKQALEVVERQKERDRQSGFTRAKTFINKHATSEQLLELEKIIKKNLNK